MLALTTLPWTAASPAPLLGPQDLQIWIIPCGADNGDPEALWPLLSGAERARADRRLAPGLRAAYIRAHAGLRLILAAPLATPPARIEFQQGPQGKPAVAGPLEFNLTTSGELALVALRWDQPVGIDCERLTTNRNLLAIARRLFSPDEVQRTGRGRRGGASGGLHPVLDGPGGLGEARRTGPVPATGPRGPPARHPPLLPPPRLSRRHRQPGPAATGILDGLAAGVLSPSRRGPPHAVSAGQGPAAIIPPPQPEPQPLAQ
jgi:hypothetical protein